MVGCKGWLAILVLLCSNAVASAQESAGAGKMEAGFFPGGGTFFVGGDDNLEANFNVYNGGGWFGYNVNRILGIEAEGGFGIGMAQDVNYKNRLIKHNPVPTTVNVNANALVYPAGSDRQLAPYVTGGVGSLMLRSRWSTPQFGLEGSESFVASNFGGGVKLYRAGTGLASWGARLDYRLFSVNSSDSAAPFFARSKRRMGHRIYVGFLYTITR